MPLPSPKWLRAGRQMQVEPCEIPLAGAPEILCRERIYAFPTLYAATTKDLPESRRNDADACLPQAGTFFSNLSEYKKRAA